MRGIIRALVPFGLGCEIYRCRVVALLDCTVYRERPLKLMPHPLSLRFFFEPNMYIKINDKSTQSIGAVRDLAILKPPLSELRCRERMGRVDA